MAATQEQLAVLTRLAFADLLLEDGAPISLILDDPLVYSDDARFEIMTDILQEAAKRMQVILLTCRQRRSGMSMHIGSCCARHPEYPRGHGRQGARFIIGDPKRLLPVAREWAINGHN